MSVLRTLAIHNSFFPDFTEIAVPARTLPSRASDSAPVPAGRVVLSSPLSREPRPGSVHVHTHRRRGTPRRRPPRPTAVEALGAVRQRALLGHRCARTTAPTATPGTTSPTTTPAAAPTAGARTAWPASATATSCSSSPWPSGTAATPSSRNASSASSPREANHGEDVKEYYFYLDSTPTHSYMKYLYKYPQAAYPYGRLIEESRRRGSRRAGVRAARHRRLRRGPLLRRRSSSTPRPAPTTSASASRRSTAARRPPRCTSCRTCGSATPGRGGRRRCPSRSSALGPAGPASVSLFADDERRRRCASLPFAYRLGRATCTARRAAGSLFTNNETNRERVCRPRRPAAGRPTSRTPSTATSSAARSASTRTRPAPRRASTTRPLRPGRRVGRLPPAADRPNAEPARSPRSTRVVAQRRREADEFYEALHPPKATADERRVQRQALAGMLWQADLLVRRDHVARRRRPRRRRRRRRARRSATRHWRHLNSMRVLSMPDKWEYPWFAAWDLAFHASPLALVDPEFAKEQLWLLLFEQFQHPNGQIPAYEWEFSDLNPPVHAWAVWRVYNMDRRSAPAAGDRAVPGEVLPQAAHQLHLVGQQGGRRGQQRLRGRLPRPGQHHRHRPQREAARRHVARSSPTPPAGWACSA